MKNYFVILVMLSFACEHKEMCVDTVYSGIHELSGSIPVISDGRDTSFLDYSDGINFCSNINNPHFSGIGLLKRNNYGDLYIELLDNALFSSENNDIKELRILDYVVPDDTSNSHELDLIDNLVEKRSNIEEDSQKFLDVMLKNK